MFLRGERAIGNLERTSQPDQEPEAAERSGLQQGHRVSCPGKRRSLLEIPVQLLLNRKGMFLDTNWLLHTQVAHLFGYTLYLRFTGMELVAEVPDPHLPVAMALVSLFYNLPPVLGCLQDPSLVLCFSFGARRR